MFYSGLIVTMATREDLVATRSPNQAPPPVMLTSEQNTKDTTTINKIGPKVEKTKNQEEYIRKTRLII